MRNLTRLRYGARSLLHVNMFVSRVLRQRHWWMTGVPLALFILAIWLAFKDYSGGAWVSFAAGMVSLVRELWPTLGELFGSPPALIEQDDAFQDELLARLQPSSEEVRDGYAVTCLPHHAREAVVRSPSVDEWLRSNDIETALDVRKCADVEERLHEYAEPLEAMLRCRSRLSYRSDPPRVFLNQRKLGLSAGMATKQPSVRIHEIGYYHSVLSNEASTRRMVSDSANQEVVFRGRDLYPALMPVTPGEPWQLLPLDGSIVANHIGVSTLVVTRDRKLAIWSQGGSAQHSRKLLAPTGSGSCEWSDYASLASAARLKDILARGMEREFVEESFGGKIPVFAMQTRVIGYFRWVRRGAKPEFVGVTWADIDASALRPNAIEVNRRRDESHVYDVHDLNSLNDVLGKLCETSNVSVPLWVNALALREAIGKDAAGWAKFLHLPS